jgi:hypothetical protein
VNFETVNRAQKGSKVDNKEVMYTLCKVLQANEQGFSAFFKNSRIDLIS